MDRLPTPRRRARAARSPFLTMEFARVNIDAVRSYWDRRPCNIRHSPKPVGSREYFDEVEARKYFVEPHIPGFAQFERWKGKKVLEVGCGIGTDSTNFARAGADLTAVDLSEKSLAVCRQRLDLYGLQGRLYQANAEELSQVVPVENYDLIYSFGVIHHTPHPERVFDELRKYCGPRTELRIMLYSKWSWKTAWIVATYGRGAIWDAERLIARYSEAETGCPVTYTYSFDEVRRLMKGYDVVELSKDHIFPYVIPKYVKYEYEFVPYFRWMPRPMFRALEKRLGWHTMIVARPGDWARG
jgi:2-polyprenyl-3-methyl-5-hydroxy-6-metoxy-1,4-benzoquinol methylase